MFRSAIATSPLCDALDTDGLAQLYDKEITTILDQLIPMRTVRFRRRASNAWFDDDCRCLRNAVSDSLNVMSVAFDALIHRTPRPSMLPPLSLYD